MTDYQTLLKTRRATRDYEAREVPLETIKEMISEACLAPSSSNGQPWQFVIIKNTALIKKLSDDSKKNLVADIEQNPASPAKTYEAILRDPGFNVFYNAPCLVIIGGDANYRTLAIDCALAAAYFMFAAAQRSLGTCWIGLGTHVKDPALLAEAGMRPDYHIVAPIIVGYPKQKPAEPVRAKPRIIKIVS